MLKRQLLLKPKSLYLKLTLQHRRSNKLSFLISLVEGILSVISWRKKETAEQLGEAETTSKIEYQEIDTLVKEQQAAADAPSTKTAMEQLLDAGKLSLALFILTGCATEHVVAYPCPPIRQWSVVEQQNAKDDLQSLPDNSPLVLMMLDYAKLRAMARSCAGE
jgi:hypothetical protein